MTDSYHHQFQIISPSGEFLESWGAAGTGEGEFDFEVNGWADGGVAFAPDGSFYVVDTGNDRIQKFGPDRAFVLAWGSEGKDDGQFIFPSDVAVDAEGRVYVTDDERSDVQVFDGDGNYLQTIGEYGFGDGQLYLFGGAFVRLDAEDNVWVTDPSNQRIQEFSSDGTFLAKRGGYGLAEGKFVTPTQLAIDGEGRLFVADYDAKRISVFGSGWNLSRVLGRYRARTQPWPDWPGG